MYGALVCSFPVSDHILSERAMRKAISHTAHHLFAIPAIFLHSLVTLVVYVNSGFVSLQIVFQVMIPEVQKYRSYEEPNEMP